MGKKKNNKVKFESGKLYEDLKPLIESGVLKKFWKVLNTKGVYENFSIRSKNMVDYQYMGEYPYDYDLTKRRERIALIDTILDYFSLSGYSAGAISKRDEIVGIISAYLINNKKALSFSKGHINIVGTELYIAPFFIDKKTYIYMISGTEEPVYMAVEVKKSIYEAMKPIAEFVVKYSDRK